MNVRDLNKVGCSEGNGMRCCNGNIVRASADLVFWSVPPFLKMILGPFKRSRIRQNILCAGAWQSLQGRWSAAHDSNGLTFGVGCPQTFQWMKSFQ